MELQIILLVLGILAVIEIAYFIYRVYKKKQGMELLQNEWGNPRHETMLLEDVTYIHRRSERSLRDGEMEIDTITWNDLDMDELYQQMNYCATSSGDIELYRFLRYPLTKQVNLNQRKKLLQMMEEQETSRNTVRGILYDIGRKSEIEWKQGWEKTEKLKTNLYIFMSMLMAMMLVGTLFVPSLISMVFILGIANAVIAYQSDQKMGPKTQTMLYMSKYVQAIHALAKSNIDEDVKELLHVSNISKSLSKIQRSWFEELNNGDGLIMLVLSQIFLGEVIAFGRLEDKMRECQDDVMRAIEVIGKLDAAYAIVSFKQTHVVTCKAQYTDEVVMDSEAMYHPMLVNAVPNDVHMKHNLLISGSNASGKSTFLKMIALNALFAQSFGFAFAKSYRSCNFRIYTSMSLRDSLEDGDSYFITEIKAVKRILDADENGAPILCMIDEILRGTNTNERIAAASEILKSLCNNHTLALGATHDIELTKILSNHYENVHFNETIKDKQMVFDYKLKTGPSDSRNAIALLDILGYDSQLVNRADKRLSLFEQNGIWQKEVQA